MRDTTGAMRENNEHLLEVAWWVILNSTELYYLNLNETHTYVLGWIPGSIPTLKTIRKFVWFQIYKFFQFFRLLVTQQSSPRLYLKAVLPFARKSSFFLI